MQKHQPVGWIKDLFGIYNILNVQEDKITIHNGTSNVVVSFKNVFDYMEFADGASFGIKE